MSTDDTAPAEPAAPPVPVTAFEKRFKNPPGLFVLFFAEMWERFSYYGMRGLLVLYMGRYLFLTSRQSLLCAEGTPCPIVSGDPHAVLGWPLLQGLLPAKPDEAASVLYGLYTGLVYLTPVFGGIIADRYFGQRKTVVVGGILMAMGQFVLMSDNLFFVGLLLLIIGNGAFKPNISTQVGNLYAPGDPRRDGAFTIFYMGINLGAFLCNFVCGPLAAIYGWRYGYGAAGVGMILGLIVYMSAQKYLAPDNRMKAKAQGGAKTEHKPLDANEWKAVWALIALCALNVVFWAVYEQQGNTMQRFANDHTIWPTIFGWQVPSTLYQSVNPFCIFVFAPLLTMFWAHQEKKGTQPTSVSKMAIGCAILGLAYTIMIVGVREIGGGRGSMFWLLSCTFGLTIGELYLSPIGLSLVTKVAPARIVSMMMGMWFLSSFFGNILSGVIGVYYTRWSGEMFFGLLTVLGVATGAAIWAFNGPLKRAIGKDV